MRLPTVVSLIVGSLVMGQTAHEWIAEGMVAYKAGQYDEAVDDFKQAISADPKSIPAHLNLALTYLAGAPDPARLTAANAEFKLVLTLDPANVQALSSLAGLTLQQLGEATGAERSRLLDEARGWCERILEIEPRSVPAHYSLGVIAWNRFYPAYRAARERAGMKLSDPGPLKDAAVRRSMRAEWEPVIQDGTSHLQQALATDADHEDAMSYMNLLIRERADFADNSYQYEAQIGIAETWVKKAIEARQRKGGAKPQLPPSR